MSRIQQRDLERLTAQLSDKELAVNKLQCEAMESRQREAELLGEEERLNAEVVRLTHDLAESRQDHRQLQQEYDLVGSLNEGMRAAYRALQQETEQLREMARTPADCGHMQNFQIGDEHGHFSCLVCENTRLRQQSKKLGWSFWKRKAKPSGV